MCEQEFQTEIGKIKDDFRRSEEAKIYSKPVVNRNIMVENLFVHQHRPHEVKARREQQFERFERRLLESVPSCCLLCLTNHSHAFHRADETAKRRLKEKQDRTCHDIEKRWSLYQNHTILYSCVGWLV
jgi:hypothetical protein